MLRSVDPEKILNADASRAALKDDVGGKVAMRVLGDAMGHHVTTIQKWFDGQRQITMENVWRMSRRLGRNMEEFAPRHHAEMLRYGLRLPPQDPAATIIHIRRGCRQAVGARFDQAVRASGRSNEDLAAECGSLTGENVDVTPEMLEEWRRSNRLTPDWWGLARACSLVGIDVGQVGDADSAHHETPCETIALSGGNQPDSLNTLDLSGLPASDRLALMTLAASLKSRNDF